MESPSIQSMQSNGSIDALCIGCSRLRSLEACLHCMQPICSECRDAHYEIWRVESITFCDHINKKIDRYLTKMNVLNPLMEQNRVNVVKVKDQIEETFQNFIKKLSQQKEDLFVKLDELEKENNEFEIFENEIKDLKNKFKLLQDELKDKQITASDFDKFRTNREEVHRVGVSYSGLKKKTFKIIGDYEKPQSTDLEPINFFGNLIIADSEILKPQQQQQQQSPKNKTKNSGSNNSIKSMQQAPNSSSKQPSAPPADMIVPTRNDTTHNNGSKEYEATTMHTLGGGKVPMFGTLRVKLKRIAEQMNELQPIAKKPVVEFDIPLMPRYIACYHRSLFIGDDDGNLCMAELSSSLVIKARLRLPLMSVKGLAVNKKLLAASFHDLTAQQVSAIRAAGIKKFDSKAGVMLFKMSNSSEFTLSYEKLIASSKSHTLMAPCGIALSESSLFVCDRELHAVFKIDIKSGNFVQKLITTDQEPVSIAIGDKYLVYTDGLKLELNLIDMDKFSIIKTVKFSDDLFYEPFDVAYKEGSMIFVKNKADTKLIVYDEKTMSVKYSFDYEYSNAQAICHIRLNKEDYLLLGYSNCVTNAFKLGLFSDI